MPERDSSPVFNWLASLTAQRGRGGIMRRPAASFSGHVIMKLIWAKWPKRGRGEVSSRQRALLLRGDKVNILGEREGKCGAEREVEQAADVNRPLSPCAEKFCLQSTEIGGEIACCRCCLICIFSAGATVYVIYARINR